MVDLYRFVEECRAAVREDPTHRAVREHVACAVSDPSGVIAALGEPKLAIVDFWHRLPEDAGGKIGATGAKSLGGHDAEPLGPYIIHTATNPLDPGAIHVYGGDVFAITRSEWDPDTLVEASFNVQRTIQMFEEANATYAARRRAS